MQIDTIVKPETYPPSNLVSLISKQIIHVPQAHTAAEALICHAFGITDTPSLYALTKLEVTQAVAADLSQLLARLNAQEPLAYLLGKQIFYNRQFEVNSATLIPRNETEELVAKAISIVKAAEKPLQILELATGSGCIAITLLAEAGDKISQLDAIDISESSIEVAKRNSNQLLSTNVHNKINILQGDILNDEFTQNYDLIISNPPYIRDSEYTDLPDSVREYEPRLALISGESGQEFYQRIANIAASSLNDGGYLLLEVDSRRAEDTKQITAAALEGRIHQMELIQDLNARDRILLVQLC